MASRNVGGGNGSGGRERVKPRAIRTSNTCTQHFPANHPSF